MNPELHVLGRAVKKVQYRQHRALDTALTAAGTTLAQWDALRAVGRRPGASARELATATFQTEQSFGTLAGRLLAQGLITRTPGHGRRLEHHLTPAGQALLATGEQIADTVLTDHFAPLTPEERTTLLHLLHTLAPEDT
ncbi:MULTISPECIES: MarR family winged helix-turn-helix transcriptional regulator [Kitasatospora]|uniref:MarR family winged helix-turn-helix transcriptional regulator n=1 Tax=Kitasatospora TaxID=2063 RepID=UPI0004C31C49|nr:MarR family transcriptional regulator [Kitasatospora sp. NRRL B-11411]